MNEEDFLKRWSRRKRAAEQEAAKVPVALRPDHFSESGGDTNTAAPQTEANAEFDVTSLPSLDSITGASDVAAFLQKGVPVELTRAALRRAWVADPAIRDFVGLAENAWDFNDPTAMPGFGPLDWTPEQVRQQVVEMFGETRRAVEVMAEGTNDPASLVQHPADDKGSPTSPEPDKRASEREPTAAPLVASAADEQSVQISAVQQDDKQKDAAPQQRRSHGSALPR